MPTFHRMPPPAAVGAFVRWFWIPEWDIEPGRASRQHIIAFPACNLVVERDLVGVSGPATRAGYRDLAGQGWAVGALLRPAAVLSFVPDPGALRDDYRPIELPQLHTLVTACMTRAGEAQARRDHAAATFAEWLAQVVPEPSREALLANRMAELIDTDRSIVRVEDAADRLDVSVRTLQRLARRYVGVPPAAMIRRRRLQEAAERLREHPDLDIASVAAELGYADQAHLAGDFRSVLGSTPSGYRREVSRG